MAFCILTTLTMATAMAVQPQGLADRRLASSTREMSWVPSCARLLVKVDRDPLGGTSVDAVEHCESVPPPGETALLFVAGSAAHPARVPSSQGALRRRAGDQDRRPAGSAPLPVHKEMPA